MYGKRLTKSGKHLSRRKDGRYVAWYGRKGFYAQTPEEAREKRDAYKQLALTGQLPDRTILRPYAEKWLRIAKPDVSERTYKQYNSILQRLLTALGEKKIAEVLPSDIMSVMAGLSRYSKSYISKSNLIYTEVFQAAVRDRIISINPCDGLKLPKGKSGSHRTIEPWERALIHATTHRCRLPAMLMLYAGLRRGEVLALTGKDISIKNRTISVASAVSFTSNQPIVTTGKNDYARRTVPIFDIIFPILEEFLQNHGSKCYIFPSASGGPCTEMAFQRAWDSYMIALSETLNGDEYRWYGRRRGDTRLRSDWKNVDIRCHDLRHTFITDARDAGIEINVLRRWVGHSSERMILQIYDHVRPDREQAETALFNAHFSAKNHAFSVQEHEQVEQSIKNQRSEPPDMFSTNQKVVGSNPAGLTDENLED